MKSQGYHFLPPQSHNLICQYCKSKPMFKVASSALYQKDCHCVTCECCLFLNDSEMKVQLRKARPCKICQGLYKRITKQVRNASIQYETHEKSIREKERFNQENFHQSPFQDIEYPDSEQFPENDENDVCKQCADLVDTQTDISHQQDILPSLESTGHDFLVNEDFFEAAPAIQGRRVINQERTQEIQALIQGMTPRNLLSQLEQCY